MSDDENNLIDLNAYRGHISRNKHGELIWHFNDSAADKFRVEAEVLGVSVEDFISGALGMGMQDARLRRQGYEGAIYQRPKSEQTKIQKLLSAFGLTSSETEAVIIEPRYVSDS